MPSLQGAIALVAGATRGAGRGIACMLGEAGATVYCTGRSVRGALASGRERRETIEETAEMVTRFGGKGIAVQVDHSRPEEVQALCARVRSEQKRLDILVNDIWGGDALTEWGRPFWELSLEKGLLMLERAVHTHLITSRFALPLMVPHRRGVVVEITDGDSYSYRGNLIYDLVKTTIIRLAFGMASELRAHGIVALAVTPGFLRSEAMLDHFGVSADNWQDAARRDPNFLMSETPYFVGRAVAALTADPDVLRKSGRVFSSWDLSVEYGFTDIDGRQPNWGQHFTQKYGPYKKCDESFYAYWFDDLLGRVQNT